MLNRRIYSSALPSASASLIRPPQVGVEFGGFLIFQGHGEFLGLTPDQFKRFSKTIFCSHQPIYLGRAVACAIFRMR